MKKDLIKYKDFQLNENLKTIRDIKEMDKFFDDTVKKMLDGEIRQDDMVMIFTVNGRKIEIDMSADTFDFMRDFLRNEINYDPDLEKSKTIKSFNL